MGQCDFQREVIQSEVIGPCEVILLPVRSSRRSEVEVSGWGGYRGEACSHSTAEAAERAEGKASPGARADGWAEAAAPLAWLVRFMAAIELRGREPLGGEEKCELEMDGF
jgi:hypothetical protein